MVNFNDIDMDEAAMYTRYSSHSQRDVSIVQQKRVIQQFAEQHNIRIVADYSDKAMTGTNDRRPSFQKMIADAARSGWRYIIVYSLDRFSRDRYDSAIYKRELKKHGIKVLSAMENISDDTSGILMESILEGLAEYYSKELSQKIRRGMDDNARNCMVNGAVPLGYVRGADGKYAVCESEAAVVREIYTRVSNGEALCNIYRDLNRRMIPTKSGKQWTSSSFNKILSNIRYTGVYKYKDTVVPDGVPVIIDQELFDIVQEKLGSKKQPRSAQAPSRRRRENGLYLLTGKLFCGQCKSPMVGISGHSKHGLPYFYYTCNGKRKKHDCTMKNLPRDMIELKIAAAIKEIIMSEQIIDTLADAAIAYQNKTSVTPDLDILKQQQSEIEKSLRNIMAAIEAGIINETTQARMKELEDQRRSVSARIKEIQKSFADNITKEDIITALHLFQTGDITDKSYQETLIDTFLVAAYVYNDKIDFSFTLGPSKSTGSIPLPAIEETSISSPQLHQITIYEHHSKKIAMIGNVFVTSIAL